MLKYTENGISAVKKFQSKEYLHFDFPLSNREVEQFAGESILSKIKHHRYLPFISFKIIYKRYESRFHTASFKKRKITLPSHHDAIIYKFYGTILNRYYDDFANEMGINDAAAAYRDNSDGKRSTAMTARDVINAAVDSKESWILKGDFKHFFDNLDHKYLKLQLRTILGTEIPDDWLRMLKSITNYREVSKKTLTKQLNVINHKLARRDHSYAYVESLKELGSLIKNDSIKLSMKNKKGIPQGTAISAVLANVYMITFDVWLNNIVQDAKGIYRRYSDDFVVVIPKLRMSLIRMIELKDLIIRKSQNELSLTIQPDKTKLLSFDDVGNDIKSLKDNNWMQQPFDYLGFSFDGHSVSLRSKSIYKFIYKSKNSINRLIITEKDRADLLSGKSIDQIVDGYSLMKYSYPICKKRIKRPATNFEKLKYKNRLIHAEKLSKVSFHYIHKKVTIRFLSEKERIPRSSMLGYAIRSQKCFDKIDHKYNVVILRQVKRQLRKNQVRLGKARLRFNK